MSIIDLSGVPFEVLSITISLISRIIFDFCFHYSKLKHERDELNNVPFMIVCEEGIYNAIILGVSPDKDTPFLYKTVAVIKTSYDI